MRGKKQSESNEIMKQRMEQKYIELKNDMIIKQKG